MKRTVIALLLIVVLLFAFGCKRESGVSLRVAALKGPTGMGLAYLLAEPSDAYSIELFDAPDAISAKLISGEADIAAVPVNLAATLYNKTNGAVVVAALNTLGVLYIVENGETVQSISDLAGKTLYASGQGSTPEYILNYLLEKNGLTDVTVEYVGEHAALAAMVASGEAGLAMLPEPNVSAVLAKNANTRVALDLTAEWNKVSDTKLVQGCYVVQKSVYDSHKKAVDAFFDQVADSVDNVNTDAGAAAVVAAQGIVPSEGVAKSAIPRSNIVCVRGDEMKAAVSAMLKVLFDANPKSVGGALPGDELYAG